MTLLRWASFEQRPFSREGPRRQRRCDGGISPRGPPSFIFRHSRLRVPDRGLLEKYVGIFRIPRRSSSEFPEPAVPRPHSGRNVHTDADFPRRSRYLSPARATLCARRRRLERRARGMSFREERIPLLDFRAIFRRQGDFRLRRRKSFLTPARATPLSRHASRAAASSAYGARWTGKRSARDSRKAKSPYMTRSSEIQTHQRRFRWERKKLNGKDFYILKVKEIRRLLWREKSKERRVCSSYG